MDSVVKILSHLLVGLSDASSEDVQNRRFRLSEKSKKSGVTMYSAAVRSLILVRAWPPLCGLTMNSSSSAEERNINTMVRQVYQEKTAITEN